jgi:hypothetical protein
MTAESRDNEQEEEAVAKQRHHKHISVATDSDATIEDTVISMQSMPRLCNEDQHLNVL